MKSSPQDAVLPSTSTGKVASDRLAMNTLQQLEERNKMLEEKLAAAEERFSLMQKATQDATWDWDLVNNIGWYSEGLHALYGYDPTKIGDGVTFWYENIHPEDRDRVVNGIHAVIDHGGKHWSDQYRFRRADGSYCWILDRGYAIHDHAGKPIRMVGSMQDISKEVEAREALTKSEDHLRLAIDSARLGTFDFNPSTGLLHWDTRCKELFGLAPEDHADYEVFLRGLHPDDRTATDLANQDAIRGKNGGEYDAIYRTIGIRDGKLRWLRAKGRGYFNEHGVCNRYAGTVIDITEEKLSEQKLIEQEQRFRLLVTMIPQIVWTADSKGTVDFITDNWQHYTGHRPTYELFSFSQLMHEKDRVTVLDAWRNAQVTGEAFRAEYRLKNLQTNEYRWYSSTSAPIKDNAGKVIRWIGSATDIDDQKQLEHRLEQGVAQRTKELSALNNRLENSNAELEQYAYVTSHDLKEPLRKVQYYSDLISQRHGNSLPEEVRKYLSRIHSSAERMTSLINDLLSYSRLTYSEKTLENVDLNLILSNVLNDFELLCSEKKVTIESEHLPMIYGIRPQLQQLFSNVIGNAVKFSKPGLPNRINVSYHALTESERASYPELAGEKQYHKIVIRDEGIGFHEKFREQIFGIFNRLDNRNGIDGHGIGLALCRKIVNGHNGIIYAAGEEGVGASITMILPKANN